MNTQETLIIAKEQNQIAETELARLNTYSHDQRKLTHAWRKTDETSWNLHIAQEHYDREWLDFMEAN